MDRSAALVEDTTISTADVYLRHQENELNNLQWIRDLVVKFKGKFGDLTLGLDTWLKHFANSKADFTQGNQYPSLNALSFAVLVDYEVIGKFSDALMKKEHFEEAYRLGQIVFAGYEGFFGVDHPKTLEAQLKIASYLFDMEEYAKALDLNRQVYKILQISNFGPTNELTITVQINVASIFMHQDKSAKSRQILQDVYERRIYLLGRDHRETVKVKTQLESCWILLQKENEAENLYREHAFKFFSGNYSHKAALAASQTLADKTASILCQDHLKNLEAKQAVGAAYIMLDQYQNVYEISKLVYDKKKKILGPNHEETLRAYYHINVALFYLKKFDEALRENKILCTLQEATLGADHKDTLETIAQIAYCLESLEKYKEALDVLTSLLPKQESIFGPIHEILIKTERNVANLLGKLGKCAQALEVLQKVYAREVELYGEGHKFPASTKRILGTGQRQLAALEGGETLVCSICLANMEFLEPLAVTAFECTHIFHDHCVLPWARGGGTCPECRSPLHDGAVVFLMNEERYTD